MASQTLAADIGTGATLTLSSSSWDSSLEIRSIEFSGASRESAETTYLGTSKATSGTFGSRTYLAGTLIDPGEVTFEVNFNPDTTPPIDEGTPTVETLTVTFLAGDGSAGASWAANAFCTSFDVSGVGVDELMTASCTYKLSGNVTVTPDTDV